MVSMLKLFRSASAWSGHRGETAARRKLVTLRRLRLEPLENRELLSLTEFALPLGPSDSGLDMPQSEPACAAPVAGPTKAITADAEASGAIQANYGALPDLSGVWHGPLTETNPLGTTTYTMTLKITANPKYTNIFTGKMTDNNGNSQSFFGTLSRTGRVVISVSPGGMFTIFQLVGQLNSENEMSGTVSIYDRSGGHTTGNFHFSRGPLDPDEQIEEAIGLGALTAVKTKSGKMDNRTDVDMYSFTVAAGQRIAFDIDCPTFSLPWNSYLRLFDATGKELTRNDNGRAPRETRSLHAYFEYPFADAGTFYVGVSGGSTLTTPGNKTYDAVTGTGDRKGSTGAYRLVVTPMTQTTTAIAGINSVKGVLMLPNPARHVARINVSMSRVDGSGSYSGTIDNRQTWVVVHGRADDSKSFLRLAASIDEYSDNDQVLVLNWSEGARDNHLPTVLDGAVWISFVGEWASGVLTRIGVQGTSVNLVGHSWGTFVTYEIGSHIAGGVRAIVALDPAGGAFEYDRSKVSFRSVSKMSWAFYGNGLYGSKTLSGRAQEAFVLEYSGSPGALQKHRSPQYVFEHLVDQKNSATQIALLFKLDRLLSGSFGPWKHNQFNGVFEGRFKVSKRLGGTDWNVVNSFQYYDTNGLVSVPSTAAV